jgi:hypothetical protein
MAQSVTPLTELEVLENATETLPEPTQDEFFRIASGTWCRVDTRGIGTLEITFTESEDNQLAARHVSPRVEVETDASLLSFQVIEGTTQSFTQAAIVFAGSSTHTRAADGSTFISDFEEVYFFDKSFQRMNSITPNGRMAHYGRCDRPDLTIEVPEPNPVELDSSGPDRGLPRIAPLASARQIHI